MLNKHFPKKVLYHFCLFVAGYFPVYIFLSFLSEGFGEEIPCWKFQFMSYLACSSYWHHCRLASPLSFHLPLSAGSVPLEILDSHSIKPLLPLLQNPLLYTPASMQPCSRTNCRVLFETELMQNDLHCDSSNERPETNPPCIGRKMGPGGDLTVGLAPAAKRRLFLQCLADFSVRSR